MPTPTGQVEPGNIDLYHRPKVKNPDGSSSTVRSIGIERDGKQYVIPTVSNGADGKPAHIMSNKEAIAYFQKTGEHLGVFDTQAHADKYGEDLHEQYARGEFDTMPTAAADQYQYVRMPDGSYGKFLASATDDQIKATIEKDFPDAYKKASAVSRFIDSALDAAGLRDLAHPTEAQERIRQDFKDHLTATIIRAVAGPVGQAAEGIYGGGKRIAGELGEAATSFAQGNAPGMVTHAVSAIPFAGPAIDRAEDQVASGDVAGALGTGVGTLAPFALGTEEAEAAGGKAMGAAGRFKDAAKARASKMGQKYRPHNLSLTPAEEATQAIIKSTTPNITAVRRIKGATSVIPDALAYAERKGIPINGGLDAAKAMRERAAEIQSHFNDKLLKPPSGQIVSVPEEFGGERFSKGKNHATLRAVNERVDEINKELKSNFRKQLDSQTTEANASDAALNAEKSKLTKILHDRIADYHGIQPEDVADVRQRAGKLRSLAEEIELSADRDTVAAGGAAKGGTGVPTSQEGVLQHGYNWARGGREVIGNKMLKEALTKFPAEETPLPEPMTPDPATTPTTPEEAQREFLRQQELEQASQDSASGRRQATTTYRDEQSASQRALAAQEAIKAKELEDSAQDSAKGRSEAVDTFRDEQATNNRAAAQNEVLHATGLDQAAEDASAERGAVAEGARDANAWMDKERRIEEGAALREVGKRRVAAAQAPEAPTIQDKEVNPAEPERGVKAVTLPEVVPPHPDTHVFSKTAWQDANPDGDAEDAAAQAKIAGYQVAD